MEGTVEEYYAILPSRRHVYAIEFSGIKYFVRAMNRRGVRVRRLVGRNASVFFATRKLSDFTQVDVLSRDMEGVNFRKRLHDRFNKVLYSMSN